MVCRMIVQSCQHCVKRVLQFSIALLVVCIAEEANADGALQPMPDLKERWGQPQYNGTRFPALKVSGVGVGQMVNVAIPEDLRGEQVCLSINAANDRYTAEQTFRVAEDWVGGIAGTTLASKFDTAPQNLFEVPVGAGLTRFAEGSCDEIGRDLTLLLSAWRELPRGETVSIYVLAKRGQRVAAQLVEQQVAVRCREDDRSSGRYTHRCDFETAAFKAGTNRVEFAMFGVRVVNGKEVEEAELFEYLTIRTGQPIAR